MSKVTATMDVYTLDELTDSAKYQATQLLCRDAWDALDSDMIGESVAGAFAWHASGNGCGAMSAKDLKKRYGITLTWSVSYSQSDHAGIDGTLSRSDAPNLAWPDGIHTLRITSGRMGWSYCTDVYGIDEDGSEGSHVYDAKLREAADEFVQDLCRMIYRWCRDEVDAMTGMEYVLQSYRDYGLQRRFREDGSYAPGSFWRDATEVPA